ncbi:hypothetical protein [Nostoc sp. DedSLP04]|uniref:hypothetical protein n=1 Tax=Nostoc sp. DedSLP04 TaxID=3075401 RepID=UPI002AD412F3|nr:hypothetical protein [Nostoc sp. DedSLP04]MDZ8033812.1 hypothetical protein [Nostoc sp. DedSLP04]
MSILQQGLGSYLSPLRDALVISSRGNIFSNVSASLLISVSIFSEGVKAIAKLIATLVESF